jgi:CHAT domain-containing protein
LANRLRSGVVVLLLSGLASIGLYLLERDRYSEYQIRRLIAAAYRQRRPGGGRLSGASYAPAGAVPQPSAELARAQVLLLERNRNLAASTELQGLIYLAAGEWQKFVDLAGNSPSGPAHDAAILNNFGASLLALSEQNPALLLKALDAFDRASKLEPGAPEPLFNMVITYRKLRLPNLAQETLRRYSALDPSSAWNADLSHPKETEERSIVERLEHAVDQDPQEAARLVRANPELCRRLAMQFAIAEQPESLPVLHFIAAEMEQHYGDRTIAAMLAPLATNARQATIALRRQVTLGARLYQDGKFSKSLSAYERADALAARTNSVFDRLWLDLNRADTQIRLGQFRAARQTLARLTRIAGEQRLLWMKAKALSLYGSTLRLTSSYVEMLDLLSRADSELTRLEAPHDRIRVLYYLAAYRYYGGDPEEALRLALECLRLLDESDAASISTLDWLIGSILYRRGTPEQALLFARESVERGLQGPYANGIGFLASTTLAELYEATSQPELAGQYLRIAEDAFQKIPDGYDRVRYELLLGILKSRVQLKQHDYQNAESLLHRNLKLYSQQPFSATALLSQSLLLLAEVYAQTGRLQQAGRKFSEAIEVVEKDDDYMKSEDLRLKFDVERRELYDSAIAFEFNHGSADAAWTYLQKYRAKLFLEFLAAFNPNIAPARLKIDRSGVQQRIPRSTQILEYAFLKDRLLIWIVTDKLFAVKPVPLNRAEVESKVQEVLQKLHAAADADALLRELGRLLIEPVADLLDPNRTITIVPDRALHGLPFGALKHPATNRYLIEDFAIVVTPSLTYFLGVNGTQPPRQAVVAFGSRNGGASEFKELAALTEIYPKASAFAGQQVDRSTFLGGLRKASIFHYAGHSATDAADPLRSSILLDGDRLGPNSVTAIDISRQRLANNAVVILSSCDSSVGNSRDGIGMRGLTSAFLIGGAGSVVGSLWPVQGPSTAELMIRFHQAFAKTGMPVAEALREAEIGFLKAFPEKSHPYYWSGFVVTGNMTALR